MRVAREMLEVFAEAHAAVMDQLEVGLRVSGQVRFACQVPDLNAELTRLEAWSATVVSPPVTTPWGHRSARVLDPDGMQVTLFQVS